MAESLPPSVTEPVTEQGDGEADHDQHDRSQQEQVENAFEGLGLGFVQHDEDSTPFDAVDLFGGPGGWSTGIRGLVRDVGIEMDEAACATRAAAGHPTIRADVSQYPPERFRGVRGLIASPPCQDFSRAGTQLGVAGYRGRLVHEVMRWATGMDPEWIACEQVPQVLPIWRDFAASLRDDYGYKVWTGIVNAADFGAPQVRLRAILMASKNSFQPPIPTHSELPGQDMFSDLKPWVTMVEGLGWGMTKRPSTTVMATSGAGGPRPLDGGAHARAIYEKAKADGDWLEKVMLNPGMTESQPNRRLYDPETEPAPTIAFGHDAAGWKWIVERRNDQSESGEVDPLWIYDRPATTIAGRALVPDPGMNANATNGAEKSRNDGYRITVQEAGLLQTFPADYPWRGLSTKQFQQVGNAIPPVLARAIVERLAA